MGQDRDKINRGLFAADFAVPPGWQRRTWARIAEESARANRRDALIFDGLYTVALLSAATLIATLLMGAP